MIFSGFVLNVSLSLCSQPVDMLNLEAQDTLKLAYFSVDNPRFVESAIHQ